MVVGVPLSRRSTIVTANELHLPVGRPVVFALDGPDVIHSFWVPQLGGKRDVVPGRVNRITLTPERAGEYWGQCAEFCGVSHANMALARDRRGAGGVRADGWPPSRRPPPEPDGAAAEGKALYTRSACVGLPHHPRRVGRSARARPHALRQPRALREPGCGPTPARTWRRGSKDPPALKPGSQMPSLGLSDAEAKALAAYLRA